MSGGTLVQTYAAHGLGMSSGTEDTQAGSPGLAGAVARRLNFVVPTSASPVITQLNSHRTPQGSYGQAYSGGSMLRPKGTAASQRSRATPVSTLSPQLDSQVKRSPALSAAGSSIVRYGVIFEDAGKGYCPLFHPSSLAKRPTVQFTRQFDRLALVCVRDLQRCMQAQMRPRVALCLPYHMVYVLTWTAVRMKQMRQLAAIEEGHKLSSIRSSICREDTAGGQGQWQSAHPVLCWN